MKNKNNSHDSNPHSYWDPFGNEKFELYLQREEKKSKWYYLHKSRLLIFVSLFLVIIIAILFFRKEVGDLISGINKPEQITKINNTEIVDNSSTFISHNIQGNNNKINSPTITNISNNSNRKLNRKLKEEIKKKLNGKRFVGVTFAYSEEPQKFAEEIVNYIKNNKLAEVDDFSSGIINDYGIFYESIDSLNRLNITIGWKNK